MDRDNGDWEKARWKRGETLILRLEREVAQVTWVQKSWSSKDSELEATQQYATENNTVRSGL